MPSALTIVVHTAGTGTTILAAVGVVLALLSLVWQALSFRLSGSRVSVEVRSGLIDEKGSVVTRPGTAAETDLGQVSAQGFTQPVLAVRVMNAGRGPTSVTAVDLVFTGGWGLGNAALDPPLSFRMEGKSEQTWLFDGDLARRFAATLEEAPSTGKPHTVRGRVSLGGSRKPIVSKNEARVL